MKSQYQLEGRTQQAVVAPNLPIKQGVTPASRLYSVCHGGCTQGNHLAGSNVPIMGAPTMWNQGAMAFPGMQPGIMDPGMTMGMGGMSAFPTMPNYGLAMAMGIPGMAPSMAYPSMAMPMTMPNQPITMMMPDQVMMPSMNPYMQTMPMQSQSTLMVNPTMMAPGATMQSLASLSGGRMPFPEYSGLDRNPGPKYRRSK